MLKGWRTVAINVALGLAAVALEILSYLAVFDWRSILPPEKAPYAILGVGVLNIVLRAVTDGRLGERGHREGAVSC